MRRQSLFLILLLAASLAVAACGGSDSSSPRTTTTPAVTATGPSATATPAATPSPTTVRKVGISTGGAVTAAAPDFEALPGAKAYFGLLGSASYRIEVPGKWNGELVIWAHGFRGFGTELTVDSPRGALRQLFISGGYAWAASSYSENGYAPGIGADDSLALKNYFTGQFGAPKRTYLAGESMGGNVIALSLENFPGEYDGALSMCGALTGEEEIDYLVSWAMVAEFLAGVELPLGEGQAKVTATLVTWIAPRLGPVESPTAKGKAFANIMMNLTGGPRPFFNEGFRDQYLVNFGLIVSDPDRATLTGRASTNQAAVYHVDSGLGTTDADLNSGVRRLPADTGIRNAATYPDKAPTTGKLSAPLLSLHNTGDLFVPISMEQSYLKKAQAAGKGDLLVQRIIRDGGHCKFSDAEVTRAWTDLVAWVAEGKKPAGENVLGDLTDAGRTFTNPLRANDPGNR